MKFSIPKRHLFFSIVYLGTMAILMLYQLEMLPYAETLRKVKYPYVFVVLFLVLKNSKFKKGIKAALLVIGLYIIHDILFGFIIINPIVDTQIYDNGTQMIWFLLFVLVTFLYVSQNNFFKGFINLSFFVMGFQLFVAGITHMNNFVNPLWGLVHAFTADIRFRNDFGFRHAGYTSNACFLALVLGLFFFEQYRKTEEFKRPWFWISFLSICGLAGLEISSAAERAGIICTIVVYVLYIIFVLFRVRIERKTLLLFLLVAAGVVVGLREVGVFEEIWSKSNRELNISVNYPLFQMYGNPWTGLGFIESAGFQKERGLFSMPTSSLDMYYVYIYFSTGLIGIIMVGAALVIILVKYFVNKRTDLNILSISFYLAMLFYAIWQCDLFTHRYVSSYIISVIFLCTMSNDCCMGEDECTSIEYMA